MNIIFKIISSLYPAYPFYFFILLLILFIAIIRSGYIIKDLCKTITIRDSLILLVLMGIGLVLRIVYTSHIDLDPYGWGYIRKAVAIKKLLFHNFTSPASLSEAFHIPGYSFLISSPLAIFNNIEAVSGFNLFFSVLTIGLVYFLTFFSTNDKFASLFAAGMLMSSALHVRYSGQEMPISISTFFVASAFLYLILWLRNKKIILFGITLLLLLVSVNIKIENSIFFSYF